MQRLELYADAAARLLAEDRAYPCYCTPEELDADRKAQEAAKEAPRYVGRCASLTPDERRGAGGRGAPVGARASACGAGVVGWDDLVRDRVEIDTDNLGGDFVIVRADGTPLYHFVVVVDDAAMAISHVIRGEDHVSNTPKHILLFEALGQPIPVFAHLPLILNPDGTKMSKRKSQTAVADYIEQGFVKEALVNYFAFLGWSPGTEEEVFSLDELEQRFEHRERPEGRRALRPRAARVGERPVDPAPRRRRPDRAAAPVPRGRGRQRRDRPGPRRGRAPGPAADRPRAPADPGRDRRPRWASCGSTTSTVDPALVVPKRWDVATTAEALAAAARAPGRATTP